MTDAEASHAPTPAPTTPLQSVPAPTPPPLSRAERLADRSPEPKPKRCLFCGSGRAPRYRRGELLGLVLEKRGELDVHVIKEPTLEARSGRYYVEGVGFYVTRTIPRGSRLMFWPEGDPEPFTGREPKGYGSAFLERLVGGSISHAVRGAFASKRTPLSRTARIALLVGGLLIAIALAFFWLHSKKTGG